MSPPSRGPSPTGPRPCARHRPWPRPRWRTRAGARRRARRRRAGGRDRTRARGRAARPRSRGRAASCARRASSYCSCGDVEGELRRGLVAGRARVEHGPGGVDERSGGREMRRQVADRDGPRRGRLFERLRDARVQPTRRPAGNSSTIVWRTSACAKLKRSRTPVERISRARSAASSASRADSRSTRPHRRARRHRTPRRPPPLRSGPGRSRRGAGPAASARRRARAG